MAVANSDMAQGYHHALASKLGPLTVHGWINDAAMSLFFLLVGLEIKREFLVGQLASWADRRLPFVAAAAGMAVPALVYLAVAGRTEGLSRGWAIPAATDIAFALGLLALLGRRVPVSLKLFVTTVAIVDDVGAVAIIALFYGHGLDVAALALAAISLVAMAGMNKAGVRHPAWFVLGFVVLWYFIYRSGVHATVAGVAAAMAVPLRRRGGESRKASTLQRLERALQWPVAFAVLPVFAFANAGVTLGGGTAPFATLPLAVALGLFVGKQAGVFGGVWIAVRLGFASRPAGASWAQVYGVALLCGIGFTMSLFIGGLAFPDQPHADAVKVGVLAGSLVSAVAGLAVLRLARRAMPPRSIYVSARE